MSIQAARLLPLLWAVGLAAVPAIVAAAETAGPIAAATVSQPTPASAEWAALREQTFEMVWETVNDSYFDPTFGGVDWPAVREKYRVKLKDVADKDALRRLLQTMLGELRRTHFAIIPREAAVFTPAERNRIGTTGAEVVLAGEQVVVSEVKAGSAAAQAGLQPGEVVQQVANLDLKRLRAYFLQAGYAPARCGFLLQQLTESRLHSAVGSKVRLTVADGTGAEHKLQVPCTANDGPWSEPMGNFPSVPVECTSSLGPNGVAYLHFNVFAREAMKPIRALLRTVPAGGGLVIDLRGNPGGITIMAPGITGWLSDHAFLMGTMHLRQGQLGFSVAPQEHAFLGPVAVLIDNGSASTSEIMAAGLQEAGRARVFGETSAGAALPSLFKTLPTGDLFQYAIADMQTPHGILIEGRGVIPDEIVKRTREDLEAGRDPVLAAARYWLDEQRHPVVSASAAPVPAQH